MTTEEFIEFAGNTINTKENCFKRWEKLEFCKSLKGGFNEKEDITRLFEYQ